MNDEDEQLFYDEKNDLYYSLRPSGLMQPVSKQRFETAVQKDSELIQNMQLKTIEMMEHIYAVGYWIKDVDDAATYCTGQQLQAALEGKAGKLMDALEEMNVHGQKLGQAPLGEWLPEAVLLVRSRVLGIEKALAKDSDSGALLRRLAADQRPELNIMAMFREAMNRGGTPPSKERARITARIAGLQEYIHQTGRKKLDLQPIIRALVASLEVEKTAHAKADLRYLRFRKTKKGKMVQRTGPELRKFVGDIILKELGIETGFDAK